MPDERSINNNQVVLMSDVRQDIKELASEVRAGNKEISVQLSTLVERLTKLEIKQQKVEDLDKEFKQHVQVMTPIRDEVLGIKKLGRVALVASGAIPLLTSAFLNIWHPWSDDTRQQLIPVQHSLQALDDRERSDVVGINNTLQDHTYKLATIQSQQANIPPPTVSPKRR